MISRVDAWLGQAAGPTARAVKAYGKYLSVVAAVPVLLFLALGTSLGLHWWHPPWPPAVSAGLLLLMTLAGAVMALLYGSFSLLFFLTLWRGRLRVPEDKRPGMGYTYLTTPLLYGMITAWGVAVTTGRVWPLPLYAGLSLYLASLLVGPWLKLLQMPEAGKGAA